MSCHVSAVCLPAGACDGSSSEGENAITLDHLDRACNLEGIDSLGLGPIEKQYLRILAEGDSRLNVIASRFGLPARTVSQVTRHGSGETEGTQAEVGAEGQGRVGAHGHVAVAEDD